MTNKVLPACVLVLLVGCGTPETKQSEGQSTEAADLLEEGQTAFRKCATCHCATDPAIAEDEDWVKMNETTACINAGEDTPRVRKAIIGYLRSDRPLRPLRIDKAYSPKERLAHGKVSLPTVAGSAYLKADGDEVAKGAPAKIRLYWKAGAEDRTLPVPAGSYRVISYAFYKSDAKGKPWMMTATDINGCVDVAVTENKTVPLGLQPVFRGVLSTKPLDEGTLVRFRQTDRQDNVATLSHNGEPHLPKYAVLDAEGKTLHEAVFENT